MFDVELKESFACLFFHVLMYLALGVYFIWHTLNEQQLCFKGGKKTKNFQAKSGIVGQLLFDIKTLGRVMKSLNQKGEPQSY